MNTLTILLQADASEEGFSAILIIGGLLFICLYFLVFYRKNFAIMKSKKSAELGELTEKQLLLKIAMDTEQSTKQVEFLYLVTILGLVLGVGSLLFVCFIL